VDKIEEKIKELGEDYFWIRAITLGKDLFINYNTRPQYHCIMYEAEDLAFSWFITSLLKELEYGVIYGTNKFLIYLYNKATETRSFNF
jgi:hypothetical protein